MSADLIYQLVNFSDFILLYPTNCDKIIAWGLVLDEFLEHKRH